MVKPMDTQRMSKKTWTGKGSKSRVENKKQYDDNYDKIFKKNKKKPLHE